jgi:hypothetical protein
MGGRLKLAKLALVLVRLNHIHRKYYRFVIALASLK